MLCQEKVFSHENGLVNTDPEPDIRQDLISRSERKKDYRPAGCEYVSVSLGSSAFSPSSAWKPGAVEGPRFRCNPNGASSSAPVSKEKRNRPLWADKPVEESVSSILQVP